MRSCLANADYAVDAFQSAGIEAWKNHNAITVVFPRPPQPVVDRWQLAVQEEIAHIITMPHVTRGQINEFVAEVQASQAVELPS